MCDKRCAYLGCEMVKTEENNLLCFPQKSDPRYLIWCENAGKMCFDILRFDIFHFNHHQEYFYKPEKLSVIFFPNCSWRV